MDWLLEMVGPDGGIEASHCMKQRLSAAIGWFGCVLFAATWPLWFQPTAFPIIPLVGLPLSVPALLHVVVAGLAVVAFACLAFRSAYQPYAPIAILLIILVLLNQHRLQPWLIQIGVFATFAAILNTRDFVRFSRLLLVSIYLFSAVSKFDYQFTHTLGQQFLATLTGFTGLDVGAWSERTRVLLALMFPFSEALIGLGLLFPNTRVIAAWAAIGIHCGLLLILGPLGLKHHLGVLVWNLFLIVQVWILFIGPCNNGANEVDPDDSELEREPALGWRYLATAILLLPLLEPFSLYDHWPAWQLYAPRNSRVVMHVLEPVAEKLPDSLCDIGSTSPWVRVRLERMSFERAWVPVYPQDLSLIHI